MDTTPLYAMARFSGAALGLVSHPRTLVLQRLSESRTIPFVLASKQQALSFLETILQFRLAVHT